MIVKQVEVWRMKGVESYALGVKPVGQPQNST